MNTQEPNVNSNDTLIRRSQNTRKLLGCRPAWDILLILLILLIYSVLNNGWHFADHTPKYIYFSCCVDYDLSKVILKCPGGRFKKTYELLNLRALKISPVDKIHIFQCMSKIFCVEFQRYPLKFHTKYLTHTLKDTIFIQHWNFKSS